MDDLILSDAVNHAKTRKKFQPKLKRENQSEPKSTPTPSIHIVEVAAATAIVNGNDDFDIENSSMQSKDAETSPYWEHHDILSPSKIASETESLSESKGNKSKKPVTEKKKAFRKRKKSSEKFSHSTRRNRIKVNPEFLKIPEDELELHMHSVPIRERVRLAVHRECIAGKEASRTGTPAINQSVVGFSDHYDEREALAQGRGSTKEHKFSREAQDAQYYNYRTHMKIKPGTKWSDQDTEYFYKALQHVGTSFEMIANFFFRERWTPEQIKSKYKREERQRPLRLNDALSTPATDPSFLKDLIEQHTPTRDSENDDDPMTLSDEDDVVATDINEAIDETKHVLLEKEIKDAAETSTNFDSEEDDMYRWSGYKSEL